MKQTVDSPDRGIIFNFGDERTLVNLRDFESVIHGHDTDLTLKFSLGWQTKFSFEIPNEFTEADVDEGDEIKFAVEVQAESVGSEKLPRLKEMTYQLEGRPFGMRRRQDSIGYNMFACENDLDSSLILITMPVQ